MLMYCFLSLVFVFIFKNMFLQKLKYFIVVVVFIGIIAACSTTTVDPTILFKGYSAEQIFSRGKSDLVKQGYKDAIKAFQALDALYPQSEYAEKSQFYLVYAFYQDNDYASVVTAADMFIHRYPVNQHVDYIYYLRGLANFNQDRGWFLRYAAVDISMRDPGSMRQAYDDFYILIKRYPDSRYAPDARQRMIYLRNLFAAHELNVAKYYLKRKAYIAAANRAEYLIQHYNTTPEVKEALLILIQAYKKLDLNDLADQAIKIYQLNYSR